MARAAIAVANISNLQLDKIAGAQLAVDAKVEQRQFARSAINLKPDADGPYLLKFESRFLPDQFALGSGVARNAALSILGSSNVSRSRSLHLSR
jgi:hypothetical protein